MKSSALPLLAAALLLAACDQAPATTEPSGTAAATEQTNTDTATTADVPNDATASGAAAPDAAASAAAPQPETLQASFRFKPVTGADADPGQPKTNVFLVLKGKETKEIDLGRFVGKPDVVDEEKARRAGFPAGMLMGFRSYEPNSGSGDDLVIVQGKGNRLQILQRRTNETDAEPKTFQTAREIPMPAGTQFQASAPETAKK